MAPILLHLDDRLDGTKRLGLELGLQQFDDDLTREDIEIDAVEPGPAAR